MLAPRSTPAAIAHGGLLFAVGGSATGSTVEAYNPATNAWTSKASSGPLAAEVNGVLYSGTLDTATQRLAVQRYSDASNAWTTISVAPAGMSATQMVAIGSKIFFLARFSSPDRLHPFVIGINAYNTVSGAWTAEVDQFHGPEEMSGSAVAVANGKIYVIAGRPYANPGSQTRLLEYDPATAVFTAKASLPVAAQFAGATTLNNKIYVVGGRDGTDVVLKTAQVYDVASNAWSTLADMPTARFWLGVANVGGNIYAVGGAITTGPGFTGMSKVEKLTPAVAYYRIKNRWQNTYAHTESLTGKVQIGAINPSWWSAQWALEDAGGGLVRFKNRWTGQYMHIENLTGFVQYGTVQPTWESAQWYLDPFNGYTRIRNKWNNQNMHIENLTGYLQYGVVYDTWASAQWTLEPVQ